jgi:signal peptide peptidase SppA
VKKYCTVLIVFIVSLLSFWTVCQFINSSAFLPTPTKTIPIVNTANDTLPSKVNPFLEKNKIIVLKLEGDVSLDWANQLEKEIKKPDCISAILWIESNGGDVASAKLTAHKISMLSKKYNKSLLVYSEEGLFSGAYWVACAADKIVVAPSGETGSIGVFMVRIDETVSDSLAGVKYIFIKSGKNKGMGFSHNKITEEEKAILQYQVNELYHEFVQYIFDCRKNKLTQAYEEIHNTKKESNIEVMKYLENISDGREYSATDALWFGLIDNVMYFDELVSMIYKNIPNVDVVTVEGQKIVDFYPVSDKASNKVLKKVKEKR